MREEPKPYLDYNQAPTMAPSPMQMRQPFPTAPQRPIVHMSDSYTMNPSGAEVDYRNPAQSRPGYPYSGQSVPSGTGQQYNYLTNPQVMSSQSSIEVNSSDELSDNGPWQPRNSRSAGAVVWFVWSVYGTSARPALCVSNREAPCPLQSPVRCHELSIY